MTRSSLCAAVALFAAVAAAPDARADLPPPDGTKFVGYAFTIENLDAWKDFAVVAFPCGGSNGAPVRELAVLEPGKSVAVGRRGGDCKLYEVARADLDAFMKSYKPTHGYEDKLVEDFFASSKVHACEGGPNLTFTLPTSDPRNTFEEKLFAKELDAKACVIVAANAAASPTPTSQPAAPDAPSPSGAPPVTPPASSSAAPPDAVPPGSRGCGGCAVSPSEAGVSAFLAVGLVALLSSRRRGRTPRS